MVLGCLTSESEERETWTAESLRAALLRRAFGEGQPSSGGLQTGSGRTRLRRSYVSGRHCFREAACGARARMKMMADLVKRCDQPG